MISSSLWQIVALLAILSVLSSTSLAAAAPKKKDYCADIQTLLACAGNEFEQHKNSKDQITADTIKSRYRYGCVHRFSSN